jgi:hypothetical protein
MTTFPPSVMAGLVDQPVRYDLGESTSPALRLGDLVDASSLASLPLGYGTSRGDALLRSLIAAGSGVDAEDVLITVGAIESMFLVAQDRAPGHAVLASPCFPPARVIPESLGSPVDLVPLTFDEGYRLPLTAIADTLRPQTRLVSLTSPQNPSGIRFTDSEIRELLTLVDERAPDAVVLIDETYRASTYGRVAVPSSVAALSPRIVTCSSLSKAHGLPGLRLGWLTTTDPERYERLRNAKFLTTIACSSLDEALATEVLRREAEILAPIAVRLERALETLSAWAAGQPVDLLRPDGGAMCCLRLHDADAAAFYRRLADEDVRVAPGSWFGDDDRVFRLGFGHLPADDFEEALTRLGRALSIAPRVTVSS